MEKLAWNQVVVKDDLFGSYAKQVADKILPYQWKVLNDCQEGALPTYCIANFKVAAGLISGTRKGVVFQDTDLYKWLEAVAYCIGNGSGNQFEQTADQVITLVGKAQEADGYLNTYYTVMAPDRKWRNLTEGHELYTAGHLIEAAVAYYEATGKTALLEIASKNAELICRVFGKGEGQIKGYPGHQEVELALVKLYRVTGKKKYLECAKYFIEERGKEPNYLTEEIVQRGGFDYFPDFRDYDLDYAQAAVPPRRQTQAEGHAVRLVYMCSAMADLAFEYQDEEMLKACRTIWENATQRRMYITGGIGSSGFLERFTTDYDLPNRTNYSETCASIGLMMFGQRMAAVTEDAGYYDVVERALYNTVLAGINIEGDRYFYVNPLEMVPEFCTEHTYMSHVKPVRQTWFDVACCPTNVARTLASLGQYMYAKQGDTIYVNQFITSSVKTSLGDQPIELELESELMTTGKINIKVKAEKEGELKLKIRIPDYVTHMELCLDGEKMSPILRKHYAQLLLKGAGNHDISIYFDVKAQWISANPLVREDTGKVALVKGPVVYCLEEIDNEKNLSAIYVKPDTVITEAPPIHTFPGRLPVMEYKGIRLRNEAFEEGGLYGIPRFKEEEVLLQAIPYGLWNNRGEGEMLVWQKAKI